MGADHLLIGLAGSIGSGKSEVARRLETTHGFQRIAFGDAIKDEVARHLRRSLIAHVRQHWHPREYPTNEAGWDHAIHDLLWEHRTEFSRSLLQEFGMMRRAQDPEYWIRQWQLRARAVSRVVNENVRFCDEAEAIRGLGGRLLRITRPTAPAVSAEVAADPTEHGLKGWEDWDAVVKNDGTLEDLHEKVDECVQLFWG